MAGTDNPWRELALELLVKIEELQGYARRRAAELSLTDEYGPPQSRDAAEVLKQIMRGACTEPGSVIAVQSSEVESRRDWLHAVGMD